MNRWTGVVLLVLSLAAMVGCGGASPEPSEKKPQTQEKAEPVQKPSGPRPTITPSRRTDTPTPIVWTSPIAPPKAAPPVRVPPGDAGPAGQPPASTAAAVPPTSTATPLRLDIRSVTSSLKPNTRGKLTARTAPGAECTLTINFPSGEPQELETKFAADDGSVEWEFLVDSQAPPGTWRLVVTSTLDNSTVTREVRIQVSGLTPTSTPIRTATPTVTATLTATATPSAIPSPTPTAAPTATPLASPSATATPTPTPRPTATVVATPTPTLTPTPRP